MNYWSSEIHHELIHPIRSTSFLHFESPWALIFPPVTEKWRRRRLRWTRRRRGWEIYSRASTLRILPSPPLLPRSAPPSTTSTALPSMPISTWISWLVSHSRFGFDCDLDLDLRKKCGTILWCRLRSRIWMCFCKDMFKWLLRLRIWIQICKCWSMRITTSSSVLLIQSKGTL